MDLPEFTMTRMDGSTFTNEDLRGHTTVLYFYPKDDTPGCTKEACGIRDDWQAFQERGIRVFGISKDDAASHQRFTAKFDLPFELLTADEDTLVAFGVWKEKNLYGRTFMGINRETFVVGPDGDLLKHYGKVKPAEHAQEILQDLA